MVTILIEDLIVETMIGAYRWEKAISQKLLISLNLQYDGQIAAETDDLNVAIDYAKVSAQIQTYCANQQCALLEKLALDIIKLLKEHYPLQKIMIKIREGPIFLQSSISMV